jgi:hypothetical protein
MTALGKSRRSAKPCEWRLRPNFSPFRVADASLMASGSVYMNERPKLGSEQGGLNVHLCEGNRAPAGVRYPPKQEAAGHGC